MNLSTQNARCTKRSRPSPPPEDLQKFSAVARDLGVSLYEISSSQTAQRLACILAKSGEYPSGRNPTGMSHLRPAAAVILSAWKAWTPRWQRRVNGWTSVSASPKILTFPSCSLVHGIGIRITPRFILVKLKNSRVKECDIGYNCSADPYWCRVRV